MIARETLKRGFVALWCLAAAAGCAKVTEDVAAQADAAALTVPAAVAISPSIAADAETPAAAPVAAGASLAAASGKESIDDPLASIDVPLPPLSVPTADLAVPALEQQAIAPATPRGREPDRGSELIVRSPASPPLADTLDVTSLLTRLRKTKAINLRTKLAVKNESDDLMERFRVYHSEHDTTTLAELRRSYDLLFRKLYLLIEEDDPPLARDIDRSRAAIWAILADPVRFGSSVPVTPKRGQPQA